MYRNLFENLTLLSPVKIAAIIHSPQLLRYNYTFTPYGTSRSFFSWCFQKKFLYPSLPKTHSGKLVYAYREMIGLHISERIVKIGVKLTEEL